MLFILNTQEQVVAVLNNTSPNACPYWNDVHAENIEDFSSTYEFEAPLEHASSKYLVAENFVARTDDDGNYLLFKIKIAEERLDSNATYIKKVICENAAISELRGAIVRPKVMTGWDAETSLDYVLQGTKWKGGICEYLGAQSFSFTEYPTAIAAIHEIAKKFEGEFRYRITLNHNQISGRYVDLVNRRGQDTGKRFEYRKDIKGLKRVENSHDIATALIGLGKADESGKRMTFASINNNLDWVGDDEALDRWTKDGVHLLGVYEDNDAESPADLLNRTKKELKRRNNPRYTYEVDVLLLESLSDYSHEAVRLGDDVKVIDLTFTPELILSARIISLTRSYTDPTKDKAVLGEFVPLTATIPSIVRSMQKKLTATIGIVEGKETVHKDVTPPTDKSILWLDMSNPDFYVWKKWSNEKNAWIEATGKALYTWIMFADSEAGSNMSHNPAGKKYMGIAHNQETAEQSLDPTEYTWTKIVGDQGVPGPAGNDGQPTYTWIRYADDASGGGMSNSSTEKKYIGIATNKTTATESNNAADYTWTLIKGDKGDTGPTLYTWVKYADTPAGGGISDSPSGKTYIGFAYNKPTSVKSNTATDYTWSLIKGADGVPGAPGTDGQTTYTWVKYADEETGAGMSDSPDGKRYLGLAYNKTTPTESTNAADYQWSPLYDNVIVDGTNLMFDSLLKRFVNVSSANGTLVKTDGSPTDLIKVTSTGSGTYFGATHGTTDRKTEYKAGETYTLSFEARGNITTFNYLYFMRVDGANQFIKPTSVSLSTTEFKSVVITDVADWSTLQGYLLIASREVGTGKWFEIKNVKLEKSNIPSGWSPNPQEIIHQDKNYNGTTIDPDNGLTVLRSDNLVRSIANATGGFKIQKRATTSSSWVDMFYVDTNGKLIAVDGQFSGELISAIVQSGNFLVQDPDSKQTWNLQPKQNLLNDHSFELIRRNLSNPDISNKDWGIDYSPHWTLEGSNIRLRSGNNNGIGFGRQTLVIGTTSYIVQKVDDTKIEGNKTYTLSAHVGRSVRNTSGVSYATSRYRIRYYNGSTYLSEITGSFTSVADSADGYGFNHFARVACTFTTPSNANNIEIAIGGRINWACFDGIQLVEGNTPTAYLPEEAAYALATGELEGRELRSSGDIIGGDFHTRDDNTFMNFYIGRSSSYRPLRLSASAVTVDKDLTVLGKINGTTVGSSDARLKCQVEDHVADDLQDMLDISLKKFNYFIDPLDEHRRIGFMAQDGPQDIVLVDKDGMYEINLYSLISKVIGAFQQLYERHNPQIEALERTVEDQGRIIQQLTERLEKVEGTLL
ncbi:phage tail spike protein [Fictibacillus sp. JL2B1089]|uniref:phage tail spike protein n=1 Tax=Fictibacillus sp. JL2B1089 TaxID=3399565 RepID=UPI003A8B58F3